MTTTYEREPRGVHLHPIIHVLIALVIVVPSFLGYRWWYEKNIGITPTKAETVAKTYLLTGLFGLDEASEAFRAAWPMITINDVTRHDSLPSYAPPDTPVYTVSVRAPYIGCFGVVVDSFSAVVHRGVGGEVDWLVCERKKAWWEL